MANGLDRLERLFLYRRKGSAAGSEPVTPVTADHPAGLGAQPAIDPLDLSFPSPSFIRPKASRMAAREEVRMNHPNGRSASPSVASAYRKPSTHTRNSSGTSDASRSRTSPRRRSPIPIPGTDHNVPDLHDFRFPHPPARAPPTIPRRDSVLSSQGRSSPGSYSPPPSLQVTIPPPRLDTPPSSDPEDYSPTRKISRNKRLPAIPYDAPPTPCESPKSGPVPDVFLRTSRSVDILDKSLFQAIQDQLARPSEAAFLRKSQSHASLLPSALPPPPPRNTALREPEFDEFLSLSDDDIAEYSPECSLLPATPNKAPCLPPMPLSIAPSKPRVSSLITLEPPHASGASTAAAFEAARIANRYDFDLIYVVNLWPKRTPEYETEKSEPENMSTVRSKTPVRPMHGRLLAAYGLEHVPSPLQISSDVHTKILQANGWIEYQDKDALPCDLARGYGSAFYPGQYSGTRSASSDSAVSGVRMLENIDRGIVFAAYRKPRDGPNKLGNSLKKDQLGNLYQDAEALVEMLMDIHIASRLRQPACDNQTSDHTGPMPLQRA